MGNVEWVSEGSVGAGRGEYHGLKFAHAGSSAVGRDCR